MGWTCDEVPLLHPKSIAIEQSRNANPRHTAERQAASMGLFGSNAQNQSNHCPKVTGQFSRLPIPIFFKTEAANLGDLMRSVFQA